jgi:hypothetical protein
MTHVPRDSCASQLCVGGMDLAAIQRIRAAGEMHALSVLPARRKHGPRFTAT